VLPDRNRQRLGIDPANGSIAVWYDVTRIIQVMRGVITTQSYIILRKKAYRLSTKYDIIINKILIGDSYA